jgi:hypothetical protein
MPEYSYTTFDNDSTLDGVDIFDVLGLYPRPNHTPADVRRAFLTVIALLRPDINGRRLS